MAKNIFFFISLILIFSHSLNAQKIYNVKIDKSGPVKVQNPNNVVITNKIDSQIIYNTQNNSTSKIYVLGIEGPSADRIIFGNPDSLNMVDINFTVSSDKPFDSAYFLSPYPPGTPFNPFNLNSPVRGCVKTISPDKKSINYKASYVRAGQKITLVLFFPQGQGVKRISIKGADKLW